MGRCSWVPEPAQPNDIKAMLDLWRSIPGLGLGWGDEEDRLRVFLARNPSTCQVLKDGARVIGTILGGYDGRRGYVYHLAVHPDYRRRGCGTALVKKVTEEFTKLGVKKIHLFVFGTNEAAIKFYQCTGWLLRGDIKVFTRDTDETEKGCGC